MPKAYVLLNTEVTQEGEVLKELKRFKEVIECYLVYGIYDIIALIEADSFDEIKHGVLEKIRSLKKIRSTITMIVAVEN